MRFLLWLLLSGSVFGQQVLYNSNLDKLGQQAATAAKAIASNPITNKELQNLAVVEKHEIDGGLQAGYLTMRAQIQSFDNWARVSRSICKNLRLLYLDSSNPVEVANFNIAVITDEAFDKGCSADALNKQKADYEKSVTAQQAAQGATPAQQVNSAAENVKQSVDHLLATSSANKKNSSVNNKKPGSAEPPDDTAVKSAASRIADVKPLLDFSSSMQGKVTPVAQIKASQEIAGGLTQLVALVEAADTIWTSYTGVGVDPRSLAPSKEKIAASLLAIDADRVKEEAAIAARNALYLDDLRIRLHDAQSLLDRLHLWYASESVEDSLRQTTDRTDRIHLIMALHLAAAGAVSNQLPGDIVGIESTIAERRAAVRRDAAYNGAYEQALQAAGQRLSAYYSSGLKPTDVAALLYYLSGIVSLPKLAY